MLAAGLMIATRCCTGTEGRRSVDISLLLVIGSALGLGKAMETTGAAETIAESLIGLAGGQERAVLVAVYLATMIFTELITNNAAAVLMFPIALAAAKKLGITVEELVQRQKVLLQRKKAEESRKAEQEKQQARTKALQQQQEAKQQQAPFVPDQGQKGFHRAIMPVAHPG